MEEILKKNVQPVHTSGYRERNRISKVNTTKAGTNIELNLSQNIHRSHYSRRVSAVNMRDVLKTSLRHPKHTKKKDRVVFCTCHGLQKLCFARFLYCY